MPLDNFEHHAPFVAPKNDTDALLLDILERTDQFPVTPDSAPEKLLGPEKITFLGNANNISNFGVGTVDPSVKGWKASLDSAGSGAIRFVDDTGSPVTFIDATGNEVPEITCDMYKIVFSRGVYSYPFLARHKGKLFGCTLKVNSNTTYATIDMKEVKEGSLRSIEPELKRSGPDAMHLKNPYLSGKLDVKNPANSVLEIIDEGKRVYTFPLSKLPRAQLQKLSQRKKGDGMVLVSLYELIKDPTKPTELGGRHKVTVGELEGRIGLALEAMTRGFFDVDFKIQPDATLVGRLGYVSNVTAKDVSGIPTEVTITDPAKGRSVKINLSLYANLLQENGSQVTLTGVAMTGTDGLYQMTLVNNGGRIVVILGQTRYDSKDLAYVKRILTEKRNEKPDLTTTRDNTEADRAARLKAIQDAIDATEQAVREGAGAALDATQKLAVMIGVDKYLQELMNMLGEDYTISKPTVDMSNVPASTEMIKNGKYLIPPLTRYAKGRGLQYLDDGDFTHQGADLRTGVNSPVLASGDGTLYFGGYNMDYNKNNPVAGIKGRGYGYYVYIDHGNGYRTIYGHLNGDETIDGNKKVAGSNNSVAKIFGKDFQKGDRIGPVKKGQLIAYSGATGGVSGPHLHFEVKKNGSTQDPYDYITGVKKMDTTAH